MAKSLSSKVGVRGQVLLRILEASAKEMFDAKEALDRATGPFEAASLRLQKCLDQLRQEFVGDESDIIVTDTTRRRARRKVAGQQSRFVGKQGGTGGS